MLIENLGRARKALLDSLDGLTDEQLNARPPDGGPSIAQLAHHLQASERATAALVLDALQSRSERVEEQDPSLLAAGLQQSCGHDQPASGTFSKAELIRLLEESRFRDLQALFNETHERVLAERSLEHPPFGRISLKNLLDTIWIHDDLHGKQIAAIKQSLRTTA
ncbi:MAG: DinB family protein [Rhodanobacter sp.]|nr:MAG: DinB family protein [Rhodanobacter sp.]TAM14132.1 MAG: DinB family protein [Rhodanobacter sp.]TAM34941.1 MAG: DinB family protein [Rhodanobacter sp.]